MRRPGSDRAMGGRGVGPQGAEVATTRVACAGAAQHRWIAAAGRDAAAALHARLGRASRRDGAPCRRRSRQPGCDGGAEKLLRRELRERHLGRNGQLDHQSHLSADAHRVSPRCDSGDAGLPAGLCEQGRRHHLHRRSPVGGRHRLQRAGPQGGAGGSGQLQPNRRAGRVPAESGARQPSATRAAPSASDTGSTRPGCSLS